MTNIDYLYNPEAAKVYFDKNYFVDKKLGFQVIEHGTILPYKLEPENKTFWTKQLGGIIDSEGKFVQGSHIGRGIDGAYTPPPRINSTQLRNCYLSRISFSSLGTRYNR